MAERERGREAPRAGSGAGRREAPDGASGSALADGKWKVLVSVVFGIFMVILDTTVINVAFPTLRAEFGQPLSTAQWIVSVYVLALGVSTPAAGYLADRFGMKRMYVAGLAVFIAGSAVAGLAPNVWVLIGARAVQAAGGGIAVPLGTAFLFRTFAPEEQGTALGYYGIGLLVAPAVGPLLGGLLVGHGLWRWIFYINVPFGLLGILLASKFLPGRSGKEREKRPTLDALGLALAVVGFGTLLYAASIAAEAGWASPRTLACFAVGLAAAALLVYVDLRRAKEPLLEFRLYANRTFLTASAVGYVSVLALFGAEFLLPLYLQTLRGLDAFQTGLVLLPLALAAGVTTPIAGRLYDRIGPRALVTVGFAVLCVNTWQLARLDATTSVNFIRFLMVLRGVALGLTVQSTFTTALGTVPRDRVARGSSLVNGTRFVVQSIGVALLTTMLYSAASPATRALQRRLQEGGAAGASAKPGGATQASDAVPGGLCGARRAAGPAPAPPAALRRACAENLAGFELAYRFTFFAAVAALVLGALLPGWPFAWEGRGQGAGGPRPKPAARPRPA